MAITKDEYNRRKLAGVCARCGKAQASHGALCEEHRNDAREKSMKCKQDRIKRGICSTCMSRPIANETRFSCQRCLDRAKGKRLARIESAASRVMAP